MIRKHSCVFGQTTSLIKYNAHFCLITCNRYHLWCCWIECIFSYFVHFSVPFDPPWPTYFLLSLQNIPCSFSVCLLHHSVTLDLSLSHTNCLPLCQHLPCHLTTFFLPLPLTGGWQSPNICAPSHVVCVIFCDLKLPWLSSHALVPLSVPARVHLAPSCSSLCPFFKKFCCIIRV